METIKERIDELLGAYVAGVIVAVDGTVTVPTHVMEALLNIARGGAAQDAALVKLSTTLTTSHRENERVRAQIALAVGDRERALNDLTLMTAERDGLASVLAEVRDECVAQRKRADALQEHLAVAALKASSVPAPTAARVVVDEYDDIPAVEPSAGDIADAVRAATENAARLGEFPLPDPSLVETLYDSKVTLLSPTTFIEGDGVKSGFSLDGVDRCHAPMPFGGECGAPRPSPGAGSWTCPRCMAFNAVTR